MPSLVPFLTKFAVAVTGTTIGGVTAASLSTGFIIASKVAATIATLGISNAIAKSKARDARDNMDLKRESNVRSGTEARRIVYGEALVGGVVVYQNVAGIKNRDLYTVVAHAGHEVHDMKDVWLDDKVIADAQIGAAPDAGMGEVTSGSYYIGGAAYAAFERKTGGSSQTVSSALTGTFSDFDSADRGRGVAYTIARLRLNDDSSKVFEGGAPRNIKCLIQGKLIYDPAADASPGADMIASGYDSGTYKSYSTNPILCAIDYMIDDRLGMGIDPAKIDWDEVVDEAAFCDQDVVNSSGGREARFTCNGVLSTYDSHKVNLQRLMSTCNGSIAYRNGKWFVKAGRYGQGANLVSNGDFSNGATDWTIFGVVGTANVVSERLAINISAANQTRGRYQQIAGLTVGAKYVVSALMEDIDYSGGGTGGSIRVTVTTSAGNAGSTLGSAVKTHTSSDGNVEFEFIATATTAYINCFGQTNVSTGSIEGAIDNVELYLVAEKEITADWARDTIGVQTSLTKQERFNLARGFYFSPEESYKQIQTLEVSSSPNLSRDNQEVLSREVSLPLTDSEDEAQRILYKLLKMNAAQVRVTFPANYLALDVGIHDRVMLTISELGYDSKVFYVAGWTLVNAQGGIDLVLVEDDSDYWRDPDENDYSTRTLSGAIVPATPEVPEPTSVTLTAQTGLPGMIVSWDDPNPSDQYDVARVYRSETNSFGTAIVVATLRANTFTDTTAVAGVTYYYWVTALYNGEESSEVATTPTNSTAAAIAAATADAVNWSGVIDDGNAPADNATVGGQFGSDILDENASVVTDIDALNTYVRTKGLQGINVNPYLDIVNDDDTPLGFFIGDQTGSSARTDLIGFTDTNRNVMEINNTASSIPTVVTAGIRADFRSRLKVHIRAKCDSSVTLNVRCQQYDTDGLGASIQTFCVSPTNADSEVTTASRVVGGAAQNIALTTSYSETTLDFGAPYKLDGDLNTGSVVEPVWCAISVTAASAVNVQIDTLLVYWEAYPILAGSGAPTLYNSSMEGLIYLDTSDADNVVYYCDGTGWAKFANIHDRTQDLYLRETTLYGITIGGTSKTIATIDGSADITLGDSSTDVTVRAGGTTGRLNVPDGIYSLAGDIVLQGGDLTVDAITIDGHELSSTTGAVDITSGDNFIMNDGLNVVNRSSASDITWRARNTNGSFTGTVAQLLADRTGTSTFNLLVADSNGGSDREFRVRGDGEVTADGSFTGGGADFAELMEWEDGNPNAEDRVGLTVVCVPNAQGRAMIRPAQAGEIPVGAISARPTVVGNSDWNKWRGKHEVDEFGRYRRDPVDYLVWTTEKLVEPERNRRIRAMVAKLKRRPLYSDDPDNPIAQRIAQLQTQLVPKFEWKIRKQDHSYPADAVPDDVTVPPDAVRVTQYRRRLAKNYDATLEHQPRQDRPEWDPVGLVGLLSIRDGQPVAPDWVRLGQESPGVSRWLVR